MHDDGPIFVLANVSINWQPLIGDEDDRNSRLRSRRRPRAVHRGVGQPGDAFDGAALTQRVEIQNAVCVGIARVHFVEQTWFVTMEPQPPVDDERLRMPSP